MKFEGSPFQTNPRRGFTIIEIIVALIIIGILTSILVPALARRTEQARVRATEQEITHLADAQERVAIDTNYYFRLYVLDDVITAFDDLNTANPGDVIEGTDDIDVTSPQLHTEPTKIFISIATEDFALNFADLYTKFENNETAFGFSGPYLNWKRDDNGNDWPDDPWGNDYIFFTRAGALFPVVQSGTGGGFGPQPGTEGDDEFSDSDPFGNNNLDAIFDRPVILSLGPDGQPGNGNSTPYGTGDDIFKKF